MAILISGRGSNMQALTAAMATGEVAAEPALVLADKASAGGLATATATGIPTASVEARGDKAAFEAALQAELEAAKVDLVCLAGFMRILSGRFVAAWPGQILNIHPSLLPLFPGLRTHARALEAGVAVHGCTVHEVVEALDAGPILGQAVVPVHAGDTAETLAARVLEREHTLYPHVLARVVAGDRSPVALFP